jgi:peroxiredoxin (alkyl hydroperoxide reductase subunit C)
MAALPVGSKAPDFELEGSAGKTKLSDLLKESDYVILAFFPAAFSPVCTSELNLYQEVKEEFSELGAEVVGISVDGRWVQQAFAKQNNLTFPVLADFHPRGVVAAQYGVMRNDGVAERALFIIDSDSVVRYSYVSEPTKNPGADRLLEALEKIKTPA